MIGCCVSVPTRVRYWATVNREASGSEAIRQPCISVFSSLPRRLEPSKARSCMAFAAIADLSRFPHNNDADCTILSSLRR